MYTIGIDVGGTKIAGGLVDRAGQVHAHLVHQSPAQDPSAIQATIVAACQELLRDDVTAIGVAAAGYIDQNRSTIMFSPNIAWRNEPLQEKLQAQLHKPVIIENDANAAAWAEFRVGAGRRAEHMVMMTLGTGVGGGVVIDGTLLRGAHGIAGEIGHMTFQRGGLECGCGRFGCIEQYASGRALNRLSQEMVANAATQASSSPLCAPGAEVDGKSVKQVAATGDPLAHQILAEYGKIVGEAAMSYTALFDPELIVLGGGVTNNAEEILAAARAELAAGLAAGGNRPGPEIVVATTGAQAGVIGAGLLAFE